MNAFISLKNSPFEIKFLLAILSSKVELERERDEIVFSGGNFGAILLPLKVRAVPEAPPVP